MKARIFDVQRASFVDGPGIRTTVFFQGCNLRCVWCHNPESQRIGNHLMLYRDRCVHCGACAQACVRQAIRPDGEIIRENCTGCGRCTLVCPKNARKISGRDAEVSELVETVERDAGFYEMTGGGLTVSGGECMLQIEPLLELLKTVHERGISTAVDTAGNVEWESFERVAPYTDWYLYDIKCMDPEKHRALTGADNRRILENYRKLIGINPRKVIVRVPVIPEYNDTGDEMERIIDFLHDYPPEQVEFLPYHRLGESKNRALDERSFTASIPDRERMEQLKRMYEETAAGAGISGWGKQ